MASKVQLGFVALAAVLAVSYGGINQFSGRSDGKLEVNGVSLDAPKSDWNRIEEAQFRLRPTSEGSGPSEKQAFEAAKSAIDSDDNVVAVVTGDEKVARAMEKARQTLPRFLELMEARTDGTYLIKFPLEADGAVEHIWVQMTEMDADSFTGLLSNNPALIKSYKMGDRVTVTHDEVSDWMVKSGNAIYGGYTMRALLDELPEDQAAALQAMLRD